MTLDRINRVAPEDGQALCTPGGIGVPGVARVPL
jgi:hypothetical protein